MANRNYQFHGGRRGIALAIRVIPRAKTDEVSEIMADGTIKIRLKAPPVEGKANQALVKLLSKVLEVPQNTIEIIGGETRRNKLVAVLDVDPVAVQAKISQHILNSTLRV
jgi:uncharacterized protein (TIGR00251 family)